MEVRKSKNMKAKALIISIGLLIFVTEANAQNDSSKEKRKEIRMEKKAMRRAKAEERNEKERMNPVEGTMNANGNNTTHIQ